MSRLVREQSEARYPHLSQFIGCYLHEDWPLSYASPEVAMARAVSAWPQSQRVLVQKELTALLRSVDDNTRLRSVLNDGLGANIHFKKAMDARTFLEAVQKVLSESHHQ